MSTDPIFPAPAQPAATPRETPEHTSTPWKIYAHEYQVHTGATFTQYFIGQDYDHPQLKSPYPVVCLSHSLSPDKKGQTTLHVSKEDAVFIVEACNSYDGIRRAIKMAIAELEIASDRCLWIKLNSVAGRTDCWDLEPLNEALRVAKCATVPTESGIFARTLEQQRTAARQQAETDKATITELKADLAKIDKLRFDEMEISNTTIKLLLSDNTALRTHLTQREKEAEGMRRDKDRLDWLEQHAHAIEPDAMRPAVVRAEDGKSFFGDTLRDAIDAALATTTGGTEA